jgi:hypothetical protein
MATGVRYVGMDVHKESITLAVAEQGRDAAKEFCTVPNDLLHVLKGAGPAGATGDKLALTARRGVANLPPSS